MEEEESDPTEDDLVGKNGAYTQSIAILHKGLNDMSRDLANISLSAGNGIEVYGQFPSFVISSPKKRRDRFITGLKSDYQLQPKFSGTSVRFVPNTVYAYGAAGEEVEWMPTIGGTPINADPTPTLPLEVSGAICYFRHTFTWNGDGTVTTNSIEIVQGSLGVSYANTFFTSASYGTTPVGGNIVHLMFSAYNENRVIVADLVGEYWAGYFTLPLRSVRQAASLNLPAPSAIFSA